MMTLQASSPIRLTVIVVAALIAWLPGGAPLAHAAAGDLDPTFGSGGKVTTDLGGVANHGRSVTLQSDGKIVVAGFLYGSSNRDFALVRYNTDGSLDPSLGTGGKVITDLGTDNDTGLSVAVQSDGKIVVAGYSGSGGAPVPFDFALVRYNTDGSLDPSFGTGGEVITDLGGPVDTAFSMALQSDGKIVVAGSSGTYFPTQNFNFALVRYATDGSLDPSFGSGGKVITDFGGASDSGQSVAVQSDGKIVVAGSSGTNPGNLDFALVRYNTDGSLDPSFGTGGKVTTNLGGSQETAFSVVVQSNGKIVVAGRSGNGSNDDVALVRYNTDGSLDPSFGTGGEVITALGGYIDEGDSVAVQSDGKIVVAGASSNGSNYDIALVRYASDGSLDPSFGSGGKIITDLSAGNDVAHALAFQIDGKIVVAGYSYNGSNDDFAVVRYLGTTDCGNGTVNPTEECDDGGTSAGDGCDAACKLEPIGRTCKRAIALQARTLAGKELTLFQKCLDRIATGKLACPATQCVINPSSASAATVAGSTCAMAADCCPNYDNVDPMASTEAKIESAAHRTDTAVRKACSLAIGTDRKKGTDDDTYVDPQTLGFASNCLDVFGDCATVFGDCGTIATSELTSPGADNDLIECIQCAAQAQAETLMKFLSGAGL
jgi:uncharacterized delta-60 repeat protein